MGEKSRAHWVVGEPVQPLPWKPPDLRIDTFVGGVRSMRLTHVPTGLQVEGVVDQECRSIYALRRKLEAELAAKVEGR
jgi:hypothetical protein